MSRSRAVKVLVGVRERRERALDEAVRSAQQSVDEAQGEVQAAQQAVADAVAAEAAERARLMASTDAGQSIDVGMLTVREHLAEVMKGQVAQRQQEVERCNAALDHCRQELGERRAAVMRNRQKIEALKEDIAALLRARQQEDDDQQDEEAEEAAITRLLKARTDDEAEGAQA